MHFISKQLLLFTGLWSTTFSACFSKGSSSNIWRCDTIHEHFSWFSPSILPGPLFLSRFQTCLMQFATNPTPILSIYFPWIPENQKMNTSETPLPGGFGRVWRSSWRPVKKEGIGFLAADAGNTSRVSCRITSCSSREGGSCSRQQPSLGFWAPAPKLQQLLDPRVIPSLHVPHITSLSAYRIQRHSFSWLVLGLWTLMPPVTFYTVVQFSAFTPWPHH